MRPAHFQISFADLELKQQGVELDPVLAEIADFIDEHEELVEAVRRDLDRGLKKPTTGRKGLTPRQVLGSMILMRVKDWDYRELQERITDGYTLRIFTDFYAAPVPKHDAFNRSFNRLTPATIQAVNAAVIQAAVDADLEDGEKLRADTTVVETNIHWAYRRHLVVGYCPRSDATDRTVARDRCQRCPEVPQPKTRGPTAYAEASAYDCRSAREPTAFHLPPAVGHHSRGVTQCAAVCRCNPTLLRQNEGGCAADRSRA